MQKTSHQSLNKTILVGISGGFHSATAAYLLKQQGFNPIGVCIVLNNNQGNLSALNGWKNFDLERSKKICEMLGIPFFAIDGCTYFIDQVIDKMVGARLSRNDFPVKAHINKIVIEILLQKMDKLKAVQLATGHTAKLVYDVNTSTTKLYEGMDIENDHAYDLSLLDQAQLEKIKLPLSDLRAQDIKKIITDAFSNLEFNTDVNKATPFFHSIQFENYIDATVPQALLKKEGPVIKFMDEITVLSHEGYHQYYIGKDNILGNSNIPIDKDWQVVSINPLSGKVFIADPVQLRTKVLVLYRGHYSGAYDFSLPAKLYVKLSTNGEKYPAFVQFQNNSIILIELATELNVMIPNGRLVSIFSDNLKRPFVVAAGAVFKSGLWCEGGIDSFPYNEVVIEDNEDADREEIEEFIKLKRERLVF